MTPTTPEARAVVSPEVRVPGGVVDVPVRLARPGGSTVVTGVLDPSSGASPDLRGLMLVAEEAADAVRRQRSRPCVPAGTRRHARVRASEDHDVWVILWGAGTEVEAHDHGGSSGVFVVVSGALVDRTVADDGRDHATVVAAGCGVALPADTVHAVSNPTAAETVSVHVYSPPLTSMGFYGEAGRERRVEAVP